MLPVALETVLVSFRIGLLAADIGDQIVVDKSSPAPWRVKIETDKSELVLHQLNEFCTRKVGTSRLHEITKLTLSIASTDVVKTICMQRVTRLNAAQWHPNFA